MNIVFTKHALRKFKIHEAAGWKFSKKDIRETVENPYSSIIDEETNIKIVLRRWDNEHDLRVIHKEKNDIIIIITFYPTEGGRYTK